LIIFPIIRILYKWEKVGKDIENKKENTPYSSYSILNFTLHFAVILIFKTTLYKKHHFPIIPPTKCKFERVFWS